MNKWIAQRDLLYSLKGEDKRSELTVRISEPYLANEGYAGCTVEVIGLKEEHAFEGENTHEVNGADTLQAIEIASNIEPLLKRLSKKYDIYFPTGESYFEEENT